MTVGVVAAIVIIAFGLLYAAVLANRRPANAPATWTPRTGRSLGLGIALGGVVLLVLLLLL